MKPDQILKEILMRQERADSLDIKVNVLMMFCDVNARMKDNYNEQEFKDEVLYRGYYKKVFSKVDEIIYNIKTYKDTGHF